MAYAAILSLLNTLQQLQPSVLIPKSHIDYLKEKATSLQSFLENNIPGDDLEREIIDAAYEAEDIILDSSMTSPHGQRSEDLVKVLAKFESIEKVAQEIGESEYVRFGRSNAAPGASSRSAPTAKTVVVGHGDSLLQLKDRVFGDSTALKVTAVVGMGGIGKTTLVHQVFCDPSVIEFFDFRAWVTIGLTYDKRELLLGLLRYVDFNVFNSCKESTSVEQLEELLFQNLRGRRYFLVLDNICDVGMWNYLKRFFNYSDIQSAIIMTARLLDVARYVTTTPKSIYQVRFLNKEESWDMLRGMVFGTEACPHELQKIGKKIAENCQGLPLAVVTFGDILSHVPKTLEDWTAVEHRQTSVANETNDDYMGRALTKMIQIVNDEQLPQCLKACFLYMGAFPRNQKIPASKLVKLWISEAFLEPKESKSLEEVAEECLKKLVDRSLVLVHKKRSTGGIKTCSTHSVVWLLCVREAEKNRFFHAITRYTDRAPNSLRRLCIRHNTLMATKGVYESLGSANTTRSLLCFGPDHPYPLTVFGRTIKDYRFLGVLDALTAPFYEFPIQILKLVQLHYLAFTYNRGEIADSLSKLLNLQTLIWHKKLSIKSPGTPSYLPLEIWNMTELRHLEVMGRDLPDPGDDVLLPNLLTLSNVTSHSCTRDVLKRTPELTKLGVRVELAEDDATPFSLFDHIAILTELKSFTCVVANPNPEIQTVSPPHSVSNFPSSLKKLTLSGCGFPWEVMVDVLAFLHTLEVLKLGCYAFTGSEWKLYEGDLAQLKHLLLEDLDIKHWRGANKILPNLERLVIRHCYSLQEIPQGLGNIPKLEMLELIDCSPVLARSAQKIKVTQEQWSNNDLQVTIYSSWEDKNRK